MELWSWLKINIDKLTLSGLFSEWFKNESKTQANTIVNINHVNILPLNPNEKSEIVLGDEIYKKIKSSTASSILEKKIPENIILPFEKPNRFNNIKEDTIKRISLYLAPVINEATKNREVDIEAILKNTQAMFANGKNYYDKDYWIQHCASSFREILVFIEPQHFNNAHKNIPNPNEPEVEKIFVFLNDAVTYLSSVVHHRQPGLIGDAEKLYPNQGYGQMKKEDFLKQEADFLERLCIDIACTLDLLFSRYCISKKI